MELVVKRQVDGAPPSSSLETLRGLYQYFGTPQQPTRGYQARLIILGTSLVLVFVVACVLFGLHVIALRRRGESLWLFRLVKRLEGRYIVGNRVALLCLAAWSMAIPLGLAQYGGKQSLASEASPVGHNIAMYCFWVLSFSTLWALSASSTQTYLIARAHRPAILSPRIVNSVFIIGGLVWTLLLLAATIWGMVEVVRAWNPVYAIVKRLGQIFTQPNLVVPPKELDGLVVQADAALTGLAEFGKHIQVRLACLTVFTVPVALLNSGSILLVLSLRRQRQENRSVADAVVSDCPSAARTSDSGVHASNTSRERALRRVEKVLLIDSMLIFCWCAGLTAITAWTAVALKSIETLSFTEDEMSLLGTAWVVSIPLLVFLTCQTVLAYRHLPPRKGNPSSHVDDDKLSPGTGSDVENDEPVEVRARNGSTASDVEKGA